ncbi:PulJ/GspJ family protein [Orrella dioscoreae]
MTGQPPSVAMGRRRCAQAGFTLIEVMVAILIMAIISVISWRGLDSITQASERIDDGAQASAALLNAIRQFERDVAWRADGEMAVSTQATNAGNTSLRNVPLLPASLHIERLARVPWRVEIVRGVAGSPGQWQRVQWWQEGETLFRSAAAGSDLFPLPFPREQDRVAVLEGVGRIDVRAWRPGQGWENLPAQHGRLQAGGLELQLAMRTFQGDATYRRVMLLE